MQSAAWETACASDLDREKASGNAFYSLASVIAAASRVERIENECRRKIDLFSEFVSSFTLGCTAQRSYPKFRAPTTTGYHVRVTTCCISPDLK
jgi:hypothetical protein